MGLSSIEVASEAASSILMKKEMHGPSAPLLRVKIFYLKCGAESTMNLDQSYEF